MGRFSKVVLLSLLLVLAGVPGIASPMCAQAATPHVCTCCMAQGHTADSMRGSASAQSSNPCRCKVAPTDSAPVQNLSLSSASSDSTIVLQEVNDVAGTLPASILSSDKDISQLGKLQHSPLHAFLCTFLV
jgi:hypothetical protein